MVAGNSRLAPVRALLLALLLGSAGPEVLDRIAAVVGDDVLLEGDVERYAAIGLVERRADETDGTYRDRVLFERVEDLLRERELRKTAGFSPDPREVEARYAALAERASKARGVPFDRVLLAAGVTRAEALDWIRKGLALKTYVLERLLPTVKVSEEEMEAFYAGPFQVEARAKGLAVVPPLREVEDQVRALLRERKLNAEIERWTDELRRKTRVVIYRR